MAKFNISGNSGNLLDTDANKNVLVVQGTPAISATGGQYFVTGGSDSSGLVAASIASGAVLMSMRMGSNTVKMAYIQRIHVKITVGTVGTSALAAGTMGFQRYTIIPPTSNFTGGTSRTAARGNASVGAASDMSDIRDSNAALTTTGAVFGDILSQFHVPIMLQGSSSSINGTDADFLYELEDGPVVMAQGDGLCFRAQRAFPGTQTWGYSYNIQWFEK